MAYQQLYTATGTYSDSTTQNITDSVTWASSNASAATITTSGLATGVGVGSTTDQCRERRQDWQYEPDRDSSPAPVSITITPNVLNALNLAPGTSQYLTATATYDNGSTHNINRPRHVEFFRPDGGDRGPARRRDQSVADRLERRNCDLQWGNRHASAER